MTDTSAEILTNEPEVQNDQKDEVDHSNTEVITPSTEKPNENKPEQIKKPKYNGRCKKRAWVFNRRDDDAKRVRTNPEDRVKRRKFLLVMGYAGANYIGMQRNPEVNTIEEELLKALFKNKLIVEEAFQQPQYTHFQRAARTDKGVSAARQCVSLKLRE